MAAGLRLRFAILLTVLAAMALLAIALFGPAREQRGPEPLLFTHLVPPGVSPEDAAAVVRRRVISPEVDSPSALSHNSRHVIASGPLSCDPGEKWRVTLTIDQDGVVATGHTQGHCSGGIGQWTIKAVTRGPARLQPGAAVATATAITRKGGTVTDRFDWTQEIVLEAG